MFCYKLFETFAILSAILLSILSANLLYLIFNYYTIILIFRSSTTFCVLSGERDIFLGVSLLFLFVTVSELFYCDFLRPISILLAILIPIKSPLASPVFEFLFLKQL